MTNAIVRSGLVGHALVALNRDAFVVEAGVQRTVDLRAHHTASDLDELELADEPNSETA